MLIYLKLAGEYTDCIATDSPNECYGYNIKQSEGEATVILKFWGMQSTPSLPTFPGPLWPGVVAPERVRSVGQIEPFDI